MKIKWNLCSIFKLLSQGRSKKCFEKFHKIPRKEPVTRILYSSLGFRLWFFFALPLSHSLFSPHPGVLILQIFLCVRGNLLPRKHLRLDLTDRFYSDLVVLNVWFGDVFWLNCCNSRWKEQRKRLSPKIVLLWWKLMRSEFLLKMTNKFRAYLCNSSRPNPG